MLWWDWSSLNKCDQCCAYCSLLTRKGHSKTTFEKSLSGHKYFKEFQTCNLLFVSKLREKIVLSQLLFHMKQNNLGMFFNDLLTVSDSDQISVLTLLDLSAALHTFDHEKLSCWTAWNTLSDFVTKHWCSLSHTSSSESKSFPYVVVNLTHGFYLMVLPRDLCLDPFCLFCIQNPSLMWLTAIQFHIICSKMTLNCTSLKHRITLILLSLPCKLLFFYIFLLFLKIHFNKYNTMT